MSPLPLGVRLKLERAREHCDALQEAIQRLLEDQANPLTANLDPKTGDYVLGVQFEGLPPPELSILVGDALFNYRSALDHLAYGLAEIKRKPPPTGTEFPIFKNPDGYFRLDKKGKPARGSGLYKIRGLPGAAQTVVEELQPFNSGQSLDDLWALHELSNIDKHRLLHFPKFTLVEADYRFTLIFGTIVVRGDMQTSGPLKLDAKLFAELARFRPTPDSQGRFQMKMNPSPVAIDVAFEKASPGHGAEVMHFFSVLKATLTEVVLPRFAQFFPEGTFTSCTPA